MTTDEQKAALTFAVGDEVEWTSQAGGVRTVKRGRVVAVVPAGVHFWRVSVDLHYRHLFRRASGWGLSRDKESYAVLIESKYFGRKGLLYWPRTSQLRRVQVLAGEAE